ncbi:MAG: hypothetical protein GU347_00020 [Desulfurococcales archaeon]|nr:hypothetical protein [Desulfurococcales archaeon]
MPSQAMVIDLIYLLSTIYSLIPLFFGVFLLNALRYLVKEDDKVGKTSVVQAFNNLLEDKFYFLLSGFISGLYILIVPSALIGLFSNLINTYFIIYVAICCLLGIVNLIYLSFKKRITLPSFENILRSSIFATRFPSTYNLIIFLSIILVFLRFLQLSLLYLASPLIWQWDAVSIYLPIAKSIFLSGSLKRNVIFYGGGIAINGEPPLVPLYYAFTMKFSYYAFRFVPVILQIFIFLTVYKIGSTLHHNRMSGVIAIMLFSFSPILDALWAHDLLYLDTAFIGFLLFSTYYLLRMLETFNTNEEIINLVFYGFSSALMLMSKETAIFFLLPGLGAYLWKKLNHPFDKFFFLTSLLLVPFILTAYDARFDQRLYLLIFLFLAEILIVFYGKCKEEYNKQNSFYKTLGHIIFISLIIGLGGIYILYNLVERHLTFFPTVTNFGLNEWIKLLGSDILPNQSLQTTLYKRLLDPFFSRFIWPFFLLSVFSLTFYLFEEKSRNKISYLLSLYMLVYWMLGYLFFFYVAGASIRRLFYVLPFLAFLGSYLPLEHAIKNENATTYSNALVLPSIVLLTYPILYYLYTAFVVAQGIIGLDVFWKLYSDEAFLSCLEFILFLVVQMIIMIIAGRAFYLMKKAKPTRKGVKQKNIAKTAYMTIIFSSLLLIIIGYGFYTNQTVQLIYKKGLIPLYLNNFPESALKHSGEMYPYVEVLNYLESADLYSKNISLLTTDFYPLAFFTESKVYVMGFLGPWSEGGLIILNNFVEEKNASILLEKLKYYNFSYVILPTKNNPWEWRDYELLKEKTPLFQYIESQLCLESNNEVLKFSLIKEFYWFRLYKVDIYTGHCAKK